MAVNVSIRVRVAVGKDGEATDNSNVYIRADEANDAVTSLVDDHDIAYVSAAANAGRNITDWNPDYFDDWDDLFGTNTTIDGRWDNGDDQFNLVRFLQSPGAVVVGATADPGTAQHADPGLPSALWNDPQGPGASNFGRTLSPDEFAAQLRDKIFDMGNGVEEFYLNHPNWTEQQQLDFLKLHYGPDGPLDADFDGPDTNWTVHGVDITAPGQNIAIGVGGVESNTNEPAFSATSAAAPQIAATVALIKSLVPLIPVTSRTDISERIDNSVCNGTFLGAVEHILCNAANATGLVDDIDGTPLPNGPITGGRFLNVLPAVQAANQAWIGSNQLIEGDINLDGLLNADDIDLLAGAVLHFGEANPIFLSRFDVDGNGQIEHTYSIPRDAQGNPIQGAGTVSGDIAHLVMVKFLQEFGDSNLDGQVNSQDIVLAFQEYEDNLDGNSGWAEGDWNGDGDVTSLDIDFLTALDTYDPEA